MIENSNSIPRKQLLLWDKKSKLFLFSDTNFVKTLREEERIKAEGCGTSTLSRKQNKLLVSPFTINKYEALYLLDKSKQR